MNTHETVYRSLLVMYPKEQRREYGEPMIQLVRDRFSEYGGVHSLRAWIPIVEDLAKTAISEERRRLP
jgi:hypothetical protein